MRKLFVLLSESEFSFIRKKKVASQKYKEVSYIYIKIYIN